MTKEEIETERKQQIENHAVMIEMQKAFTALAISYAGMIERVNKLLDKCEPLIDGTLEKFKEEGSLGS